MRISRLLAAGTAVVAMLWASPVGAAPTEQPGPWQPQIARSDSPNLAAIALGDGRVRAVGVQATDPTRMQVVLYDQAGNENGAATVPGPGAVLREPRGIAAYGDNVVVQFATTTGFAITRLAGTSKVWSVAESLGSCGPGDGEVIDVAVAPDGSVYSASWNFDGNVPPECDGTGIRKFTGNGQRVTNWGQTTFEGSFVDNRMEANAIAVGGDGSVYVAGVEFGGSPDLEQVGVLKLTPGGARAAGFGTNGLVGFQPGVAHTWWGAIPGFSRAASSKGATDVAVDGQGRILLVGGGTRTVGGNGTSDLWVARLTPSGQLDGSFGTGGLAHLDLGGGHEYGMQIAVDPQNRPVVAGVTNPGPLSADTDARAEFTARLTASGVWESATIRKTDRGNERYLLHTLSIGGDRIVTAGALRDSGSGYITLGTLPGSTGGGSGGPSQLFTGMVPWRALDTRDTASPLTALEPRAVAVAGVPGGAPGSAVAVALNVTVVDPTAGGYLTVYPGGAPPTASTLNFTAQQTIANALVVGVDGGNGTVNVVLGAGRADVIVDVMGWFGANQNFVPTTPVRAVDTRIGAALGPNEARTVTVAGLAGAPGPGLAKAVTLNITAVDPTAGGHLRAWPGTGADAPSSVLNFAARQTVANALTLGVDGAGRITVRNYSAGTVHLVIDVSGTFVNASSFTPITPVRAHDSRAGAALGPGEQRSVKVTGSGGVPDNGTVRGVVVNITVTAPSAAGYFSAFPTGGPAPLASLLNFTPGIDIANGVIMGVGPGGSIDLLNSVGTTHAIVDVLGWF